MKLTIESTQNGYIISTTEINEDENIEIKEVIEEINDPELEHEEKKTHSEEQRALRQMLLKVSHYFGDLYDKWSQHNLDINFNEEGSHYCENDK
jgi:hypothetical protein